MRGTMGAWGMGTFDNDEAGDWVYQLEATHDLERVRRTLAAATQDEGYLEATTCCQALAAAEVVAALAGRPAPDLPEGVLDWMRGSALTPLPDLRALSLRAVDRVTADSELKDLWDETEERAAWEERTRDLQSRLGP